MGPDRPDEQGRVLGNWRLGQLLGEGGFGAVYEAQHVELSDRRAAVKLLHPQLSRQSELRRRFINEANAASRADHEHIVQIFDGGTDPSGTCFVAMELLRGRSLSKALAPGPLSPERVVHIGSQVASALAAAHRARIIHRDLKPDNIFLVERQNNPDFVKLLDFGVAKVVEDDRLTKTGVILGTPAYMSPEQWRCVPDLDGRADLYSLGVILFRCVTGELPFQARTVFDWMQAHLFAPAPDACERVTLPRALNELIHHLLAKAREDRPSSAQEVSEALARCLDTTLKASQSHPALSPAVPSLVSAAEYESSALPTARPVPVPVPVARPARDVLPVVALRPATAHKPAKSIWLSLHDLSSVSRSLVRRPVGNLIAFATGGLALTLGIAWLTGVQQPFGRQSAPVAAGLAPAGQGGVASQGSEKSAPPSMNAQSERASRRWTLPEKMVELGPGKLPPLPAGPAALRSRSGTALPVSVPHFALGRYEVSLQEYRAFAEAAHLPPPNPWTGVENYEQLIHTPVNQVTRAQATAYCASIQLPGNPERRGRLPYRSEWEFAARNGQPGRYYLWRSAFHVGSVNFQRQAADLRPLVDVDSQPNAQSYHGISHLFGNVAEWMADDTAVPPGKPLGLTCGGNYLSKSEAELADCLPWDPERASGSIGFRCALDLPE